MANKITKKERYEAIRELVKDNPAYVEFIDKEIAKLDNRAEKVAKKRAEKNGDKAKVYTEAIIRALEDAGRAITLVELVAAVNIEGATPGRVAYYTGKLVNAGEVVKEATKVGERLKIMSYALASTEPVDTEVE